MVKIINICLPFVHIKICNYENNNISTSRKVDNNNDDNDLKDVIMIMMNENKELRNILMDQQEQLKSQQEQLLNQQSEHNNQITEIIPKIGNSTNNTFNINMYLNNDCKDAMNISDFTRKLEISMSDFVTVGKNGYVDGISKIILNAIKDMDVTKRPLQCSDAKRETLYVKDNNAWEKDQNKEKLNKAISSVGRKALQHFPAWMKLILIVIQQILQKIVHIIQLLKVQYHKIRMKTKKIAKNIIKEVIINK